MTGKYNKDRSIYKLFVFDSDHWSIYQLYCYVNKYQ